MAGALAQHAEATMDRIGPERQTIVREIFRNLVTAQGTRAVAEREELLSAFPQRKDAEEVLRELIDARLLTSYEVEGREGEPSRHRVEVVHESLLKAWPRLVRWQAQDEEGAVLRDQLKQAAHLWEEKGRTQRPPVDGDGVPGVRAVAGAVRGGLTALEEDFAKAMAERAARQRRRRLAVAGAVVAASLAVAGVTGVLWARARAAALRAEASKLVALGRAELDRYPTAAVAYGRKSLEVADTAEGRRFVVDALWRSPTARILPLGKEVVWRADFSPDGRWLAAFPFSGRLLLFGDDGGAPRIVQGQPPTGSGRASASRPRVRPFSPSHWKRLRVHMYSVPDGREIRRFEPEPPGGYGAIPRPKPGSSNILQCGRRCRRASSSSGRLLSLRPAPASLSGSGRTTGVHPRSSDRCATRRGLIGVDPQGSRFLLRRGSRLVVRPLVGGADDTLEKPVVALGEDVPIGLHGFDPQGDKVWCRDKHGRPAAGVVDRRRRFAGAAGLLDAEPGTGLFPRRDPTGSRVAWGSSAEKAVWLWDLAGPPDAAPDRPAPPGRRHHEAGPLQSQRGLARRREPRHADVLAARPPTDTRSHWPRESGHAPRLHPRLAEPPLVRSGQRPPLAAPRAVGRDAEDRLRLPGPVLRRRPFSGRGAARARRNTRRLAGPTVGGRGPLAPRRRAAPPVGARLGRIRRAGGRRDRVLGQQSPMGSGSSTSRPGPTARSPWSRRARPARASTGASTALPSLPKGVSSREAWAGCDGSTPTPEPPTGSGVCPRK